MSNEKLVAELKMLKLDVETIIQAAKDYDPVDEFDAGYQRGSLTVCEQLGTSVERLLGEASRLSSES